MILDITPMGAPRMTRQDQWTDLARRKGRPVVLRYFEYQNDITKALPTYKLPVTLRIDFHIAMPKSYSKKKRALLVGTHHDQKPDIDNLVKGFMDTFKDEDGKGDDKHVADLHARKIWAEKGAIEIHD